jgi:hypothetical protein
LFVNDKWVILEPGVAGYTDGITGEPVRLEDLPLFLERDAWCGP